MRTRAGWRLGSAARWLLLPSLLLGMGAGAPEPAADPWDPIQSEAESILKELEPPLQRLSALQAQDASRGYRDPHRDRQRLSADIRAGRDRLEHVRGSMEDFLKSQDQKIFFFAIERGLGGKNRLEMGDKDIGLLHLRRGFQSDIRDFSRRLSDCMEAEEAALRQAQGARRKRLLLAGGAAGLAAVSSLGAFLYRRLG